jgi:hypothetical protein
VISRQSEKGATAVELALLLPIFVLLLIGMFEFGIAFNHYLYVIHAAREGARLAAVGMYSESAVRDRAGTIGYQKDEFGNYLLKISKEPPDGQEQTGEPVRVTVTYPEAIGIPFFGVQEIELKSVGVMRFE